MSTVWLDPHDQCNFNTVPLCHIPLCIKYNDMTKIRSLLNRNYTIFPSINNTEIQKHMKQKQMHFPVEVIIFQGLF